jgi:chromosomal replication initiator protein
MRSPLDDAWMRLDRELFSRLGPERYAAWVRNALPLSLDEEEFLVHFESTYAKDKVEALFKTAVVEAVRRVTNRNIRVRFLVEGESFPLPRAAALHDETRRDGPVRTPPLRFDTFVEGRGNRTALQAARAFAAPGAPPFRTLLIHAASGLGKTHLLRAIGAELSSRPGVSVLTFTGEQFSRHFDYACVEGHREAFLKRCRSAHVFLFDDLHLLAGREAAQKALLETVLALGEKGSRTALTCDRHPRAVDGLSRSVRNRLRADREVSLDRPDAATSAAFLRACAPAGTPPTVLDHLAANVPTSHKDQLACLARILEAGPATLPAARAVVGDFLNRWSGGLTCEDIARATAESFGVSLGEIYTASRSRAAAEARGACFYLARKILGRPYAAIGAHFGGRDHATVLVSCRRLSRRNGPMGERLRKLEEQLVSARR